MTALAQTPSFDRSPTSRDHLIEALTEALSRQQALRARSARFDERARLQSEIHALRALIAQTEVPRLAFDEPAGSGAPARATRLP